MSDEARVWAKTISGLRIPAKAVLNALAGYADAEGLAWPKLSTIAIITGMSQRYVRRQLATLEQLGLFRREPRYRQDGPKSDGAQTSNFYTLAMPREQLIGDTPPEQLVLPPRNKRTGAPGTSVPPIRTSQEESCSDEQLLVGSTEFEVVWGAWTKADPSYTKHEEAAAAWAEAVDGPHEPWQLRDAMLTLLQVRPQAGSRVPEWLHVTLRRGPESWGHLLPPARAASEDGPPARTPFAGPPELRQAVVSNMGEAWTVSWFDCCSWDSEGAAVVAPTKLVLERLRLDLGRDLSSWGVKLAAPPPARAVA